MIAADSSYLIEAACKELHGNNFYQFLTHLCEG